MVKFYICGPRGSLLISCWYTDEALDMFRPGSTFGSPFGNMKPISLTWRCCAKYGWWTGRTGTLCWPGPKPAIARLARPGWFIPKEKPGGGPNCCLPGKLNEPIDMGLSNLAMLLWTCDGSGRWGWVCVAEPETWPDMVPEGPELTWLLLRAAGTSWLCFPSYVVMTDLRSWDALSTCFLTVQPALVHL